MIIGLSIRDVVLIDRLDLSFDNGLSALTGETGAGKSILLDSLGLALGARSESGLVRAGADRSVVSVEFEVPESHPALALAREHGLDDEDRLILRRTVGRDGRSRAHVNDQSVSVGLLRQIGDRLVEIQGQFDQHGLLDSATHRGILDAFGGLEGRVSAVSAAHGTWRDAVAKRIEAEQALAAAAADEELLRHAVAELDALAPRTGEAMELEESRRTLAAAEQIIAAMTASLGAIEGEQGAENAIGIARRLLDKVADQAGHRLEPALSALDRAAAEIQEASASLSSAAQDIETDAGRLEEVDDRLHALRGAARKHGVEVDDLEGVHRDIAARLAALDDQGGSLSELAVAEKNARSAYITAADALSECRAAAASALDASVARELPPLKLDRARFTTRVETGEEADWSATGKDKVFFEVATNPGSAPGPLARIASGGELSRFLLALKVVLAEADPIDTLIFDEVDSGVGGAVAAAVGERLARLGERLQVLVVTHSPQVAAKAGAHWRVAKREKDQSMATSVSVLTQAERQEEIARMLAGETVTEEARAAAARLMDNAPEPKGALL